MRNYYKGGRLNKEITFIVNRNQVVFNEEDLVLNDQAVGVLSIFQGHEKCSIMFNSASTLKIVSSA
jgi:hypothetical protein